MLCGWATVISDSSNWRFCDKDAICIVEMTHEKLSNVAYSETMTKKYGACAHHMDDLLMELNRLKDIVNSRYVTPLSGLLLTQDVNQDFRIIQATGRSK